MGRSPTYVVFAVFAALVAMSSAWRRKRIRRAVRYLPERMQRLLGPGPDYAPPAGDLPEGLRDYASMHRRTRVVMHICWGLGVLWLAFIAYEYLKGAGL